MSNVVQLKVVPKASATTAAFEEAWKAFPDLGRLRSSRKESSKEWARVAREVGEQALVNAVRRYAAEDKEHKRECGPPGFHRWLKWGRYEHWLGGGLTVAGIRFPDEHIRRQVVLATSEAFAVSYLDPCAVDGTVLVPRTGFAIEKLREKADLFRSLGFTGMRRATQSVDKAATDENKAGTQASSGCKSPL